MRNVRKSSKDCKINSKKSKWTTRLKVKSTSRLHKLWQKTEFFRQIKWIFIMWFKNWLKFWRRKKTPNWIIQSTC